MRFLILYVFSRGGQGTHLYHTSGYLVRTHIPVAE